MSRPSFPDPVSALWVLLLASSTLYFFSTNDADPDLWGHIFFGRHILATVEIPRADPFAYTSIGQRWIDHEWLAQVILAAVFDRFGTTGLLLLKLFLGAATTALVASRLRRRTTQPWLWGGVTLMTIAVLARGFAFRPQIFTYFAAALVLALLDAARNGRLGALWFLPPLFAVWVNLHGGFMLGLGIVALFTAGETLRAARTAWRVWAVAVASLAATAVNPYGPNLLSYIWDELRFPHPITEWQPTTPEVAQGAFFCMLVLFTLTLPFARKWRSYGWEACLAATAAVLALRHQRHTPVFALCAAAPLAAQLAYAAQWLRQRSTFHLSLASRGLLTGTLIALVVVQLASTAWRLQRDGLQIVFDAADYPTGAVRALQAAGVRLNLAVPLEWGEYALWFLAPGVKVSLDGRFATVFSADIVRDNFDFFAGVPGWQRLIEDYPTDAALVPRGSPCPIRDHPNWRRVYADSVSEVYLRAGHVPGLSLDAGPAPPTTGIFP